MELTRGIADFIHKTSYYDFSPKEVQAAKDLILDAIGGMIGGARERVTAITIEYARETGGKEECGFLGYLRLFSVLTVTF